jgi:hypothetical protein
MKISSKKILSLLILLILPFCCFAIDRLRGVSFFTHLFDYLNFAVIITSLISIKQYFWPGDEDRTIFHVFNIIFVVLFYFASLSFLIGNKEYYDGYQRLNTTGCLKEFFFGMGIDSYQQWIAVVAVVINILYINRSVRSEI